ncbi:hypothetical protein FA95DRAFT_1611145 [Auriscalpium vulgare]|uniref:Uncharacterized protein n=1 Tax=Auriscalpium vulgare TaxID=40419 RepID=A0ACB8RCG0_9AGAM|nr:hypothetical protein FA95DRAFT_1611145 [Auriscalpium vulgare]
MATTPDQEGLDREVDEISQTWQGRVASVVQAFGCEDTFVLPRFSEPPWVWKNNLLARKVPGSDGQYTVQPPTRIFYHGRVVALNMVDEYEMPLAEVGITVMPMDCHIFFSAEHLLYTTSAVHRLPPATRRANFIGPITATRMRVELRDGEIRVKRFREVYYAIGTTWPQGEAVKIHPRTLDVGDIVMVEANIQCRTSVHGRVQTGFTIFQLVKVFRLAYWSHNVLIDTE